MTAASRTAHNGTVPGPPVVGETSDVPWKDARPSERRGTCIGRRHMKALVLAGVASSLALSFFSSAPAGACSAVPPCTGRSAKFAPPDGAVIPANAPALVVQNGGGWMVSKLDLVGPEARHPRTSPQGPLETPWGPAR